MGRKGTPLEGGSAIPPASPRSALLSDPWSSVSPAEVDRRKDKAGRPAPPVHAGLPEPPDLADRQEGRKPYDQATDILATIECVLADKLRPAVEALHRSAQITDAELEAQYREWLSRRLDP
jgi:hypothetical protein